MLDAVAGDWAFDLLCAAPAKILCKFNLDLASVRSILRYTFTILRYNFMILHP